MKTRQPSSAGFESIGLLLPLFPTQEGGEGWGEEEFPSGLPLSPALSPLVPRGERETRRLRTAGYWAEKPLLKFNAWALCLLLLALWLAPILPSSAQPVIDTMIFTAGTTVKDAVNPPQQWAYLLWQARLPELLTGRAYAIYQKPGGADSPSLYQRKSVVTMQSDPTLIKMLLERAVSVGDDTNKLAEAIQAMFQSLMPPSAKLEDRIAIVLQGSKNNADYLRNLVLLARTHPAMSLCLGFAHAQPLPGPGQYTFEVRLFDPARDQDLGVTGRVTVQPGNPVILPPPGRPFKLPDLAGHEVQGHLNAKLRWAVAPALKELSLLHYGFNVYRLNQAFAVSNNYHLQNSPLTTALLLSHAANDPTQVKRLNRIPVLASKKFDDITVANFIPPTGDTNTFFFGDDNRPEETGVRYQQGDAFYYVVTARDILGRDGAVSPPSDLVTICDRMPPHAPKGLVMENHYTFDPVTKASNQVLRATWNQNINTPGETVVEYWLYRWNSATEMINLQDQPLAHRIAVKAHVNGPLTLSQLDQGLANSPTMANDAGKTFWYSVRAKKPNCTDPYANLSPHSALAFGVLRDREGPAAPTGCLTIRCCRPESTHTGTETTTDTALNPASAVYKITVTRDSADIERVEIFAFDPGQPSNAVTCAASRAPVDCGQFPSNATQLTIDYSLPRARVGGSPASFHCRALTVDGEVSEFGLAREVATPPSNQVSQVSFTVGRRCRWVELKTNALGLPPDCRVHYPQTPDDDTKAPIKICLDLKPGAKEWRLYRRVDLGPLTLLKQGLADYDQTQQVCFDDFDLPIVNPGEVCYYGKLFDQHGNGSPMALIGCTPLAGKKPKPLLAPLEPDGDSSNPQMTVRWFCSPYGVERFIVFIAEGLGDPPQTISAELSDKQGIQMFPAFIEGKIVLQPHGKYLTQAVGPGFGSGAQFTVTLNNIKKNVEYAVRVQALGKDGLPGKKSNVERLTWSEALPQTPEVPWPAHPLPAIVSNLFLKAVAVRLTVDPQYPVGIRIGEANVNQPSNQPPFLLKTHADPTTYLDKGFFGLDLFPVALYRYQVPNPPEFPVVSGDITQVSPLMEKIAYQKANDSQLGPVALVHDPFIAIYPVSFGGLVISSIYLLDTQPVIERARYGYLLVRFGPDKEVLGVAPAGEVEITP